MEFNKLVNVELLPILQKYGFEVIEEFKNIVRLQSSKLKINFVFNDYDKGSFVEIGKQNELLYPLNDRAIKNVFNSDLPIENVIPEIFVYNLSVIFQQKEGIEILSSKVNVLNDFVEQECNNFTARLLEKQILEMASKAWESKDYKGFIKNIDEIGIEKIPQSFKVKYNIAKQKIG